VTKARCSICMGVLDGYGRSAQPVSDGLCCTQCNHDYVLPARLARLQAPDAKPLRAVEHCKWQSPFDGWLREFTGERPQSLRPI